MRSGAKVGALKRKQNRVNLNCRYLVFWYCWPCREAEKQLRSLEPWCECIEKLTLVSSLRAISQSLGLMTNEKQRIQSHAHFSLQWIKLCLSFYKLIFVQKWKKDSLWWFHWQMWNSDFLSFEPKHSQLSSQLISIIAMTVSPLTHTLGLIIIISLYHHGWYFLWLNNCHSHPFASILFLAIYCYYWMAHRSPVETCPSEVFLSTVVMTNL